MQIAPISRTFAVRLLIVTPGLVLGYLNVSQLLLDATFTQESVTRTSVVVLILIGLEIITAALAWRFKRQYLIIVPPALCLLLLIVLAIVLTRKLPSDRMLCPIGESLGVILLGATPFGPKTR